MTGPFETEREARAAALELGGPPRSSYVILSAAQNREMLTEACRDTGVELGTYDARILDWIAGFEDSTCAVIVGLVHRAHQAGIAASPPAVVLDVAQLGRMLSALTDAAEYRRKKAGQ